MSAIGYPTWLLHFNHARYPANACDMSRYYSNSDRRAEAKLNVIPYPGASKDQETKGRICNIYITA